MRFAVIAAALAAGLGLAAPDATAQTLVPTVRGENGVQCATLYAGQTIDAGSVCVTVAGDDLVVTYTTTGGWEIVETHLWVGDSLAQMPQTRTGNPQVGRFPYKSGTLTGATTWSVTIPLSDYAIEFTCDVPNPEDVDYKLAAHAALRKSLGGGKYQTETGWADGVEIVSRGNWATVAGFTLYCQGQDEPPQPELQTETAFARDAQASTCFLDLSDENGAFNRWGWTNGAYAPGYYRLDVYAAAGQCDLSKGTLVGELTIDYDGHSGHVLVTFTSYSGYSFEEAHLYVGSEVLPRDKNGGYTVAPGQYPEIEEGLDNATSVTFLVTGMSGDIYVVAHAVAAGTF